MENNKEKKTKGELTRMAGKYLDPKADLIFKLVFGEHKDLVMSEEQLYAYDKFWMTITDEEGFLEARYYKGRAEGHEKGLEEGRAEGKDEAKREHARKMKSLGMPIEVITQVTGFTENEIESL